MLNFGSNLYDVICEWSHTCLLQIEKEMSRVPDAQLHTILHNCHKPAKDTSNFVPLLISWSVCNKTMGQSHKAFMPKLVLQNAIL